MNACGLFEQLLFCLPALGRAHVRRSVVHTSHVRAALPHAFSVSVDTGCTCARIQCCPAPQKVL